MSYVHPELRALGRCLSSPDSSTSRRADCAIVHFRTHHAKHGVDHRRHARTRIVVGRHTRWTGVARRGGGVRARRGEEGDCGQGAMSRMLRDVFARTLLGDDSIPHT